MSYSCYGMVTSDLPLTLTSQSPGTRCSIKPVATQIEAKLPHGGDLEL